MSATPCPCGGPSYATCCEPRHTGAKPAPTAEALMRSRYSGFVHAQGKYLEATRFGERRFGAHADLEEWAKKVTWLGLTVHGAEQGGQGDEVGVVTYTARYIEDDVLLEMTERAQFRRDAGGWKYVEAEPEVKETKLERNGPCPCGSGKKYKQCHLR